MFKVPTITFKDFSDHRLLTSNTNAIFQSKKRHFFEISKGLAAADCRSYFYLVVQARAS